MQIMWQLTPRTNGIVVVNGCMAISMADIYSKWLSAGRKNNQLYAILAKEPDCSITASSTSTRRCITLQCISTSEATRLVSTMVPANVNVMHLQHSWTVTEQCRPTGHYETTDCLRPITTTQFHLRFYCSLVPQLQHSTQWHCSRL